MVVHVKLFATLRQNAGWTEREVTLPTPATIGDLVALLDRDYPGLDLARRSAYAAVNQAYAGSEQSLSEGDEVALFPPVSGGQESGYAARNKIG